MSSTHTFQAASKTNVTSNEEFKKYITEGKGPVVLDAFAEWYDFLDFFLQKHMLTIVFRCGPCKMIAPIMEKLVMPPSFPNAVANDRRWSGEYKDAKFYKFDVDQLPDVAQELGISAMPTFLFFKDGTLDDTIVGANVQKLQTTIAALGSS